MKVAYRFKDREWSAMFYNATNDTHVTLYNVFLPILREEVAAKLKDIYDERCYTVEEYVEIPTKHSYHLTTIKDTTPYIGMDVDSYSAIHNHTGYDVCRLDTVGVIIPKNIDFYREAAKDMLAYIQRWHSAMNHRIHTETEAIESGKVYSTITEEMEQMLEKYR